jgi:hypothetical protein
MAQLNDKSIREKLDAIRERWADNMNNVCEPCMYEALRHWDRNMDPACNPQDNAAHPDRYDGDVYAYAGGDIKELIQIIDMLLAPVEK